MRVNYLAAIIFLLCALSKGYSAPPVPDSVHFVVAQDGTGNFRTVQEAINAVPDLRKSETKILIRKGTYKEKLTLPSTKTNVVFIGEDRDSTFITYDDYASKKNNLGESIGTSGSSGFFVFGDGFTASNLTFENTAGPIGQAVAVRVTADKVRFVNCRFLGNQDTLYPHGRGSRQYYKNCYIEGTVDFIFGSSTCLFDSCTLFAKRGGYLTAASTPKEAPYGFVFRSCHITGSAPAGSVYLGRPWRPYAKTVFLNCQLDSVVHPVGWHDWGKPENQKTAFYAEYKNYGKGAKTDQRVAWGKQLKATEIGQYELNELFRYSLISSEDTTSWNPMR